MNKLVAIIGPTASGKTALAISIAKKYNGEIICADSRTIYKGLDIGTAKPTPEEQSGIKHYGLDLVNPDQRFSVGDFQKLAMKWIADIQKRGKLPIMVGGTGLYVDSVLYNYSFSPPGAERDPKNPRHLNESARGSREALQPGTVVIGLDPGKEILEKRINERAQTMIDTGVLKEAEWLKDNYGWQVPGASGNIYRGLMPFFEENQSIGECLRTFATLDRQLAKRQRTWFKRNKDVQWFSDQKSAEQFLDSILMPLNTHLLQ